MRSPALRLLCVAALIVTVALPAKSKAQAGEKPEDPGKSQVQPFDKMPDSAVMHRGLGIFRYNPLGLQWEQRLMYRVRLSDSDNILFRNTWAAIGPQVMVSPSLQRIGLRASAKPIAVLELFALVEHLRFIGTFDYMQSYPDASADFSTKAQKANTEAGKNYAAGGWQVSLSGRLQAKVKSIAVRSTTRMNRHWMDTRDNEPVWFDIYTDQLSPRDGWTMQQDNDVLYVKDRLVIGIRHTWSRSWLSDAAMKPVAEGAPRPDQTHRVGPLIAWKLRSPETYADKAYRSPTLLLIAQFWAVHPYRAGQEITRAIPWLILGYTFDGRVF